MEFQLQTLFFDHYLTPGIKIKIQNLIAYLQDIPNHIVSFAFHLKCRWSSSYKPYKTENVIVRPSYDPRGQKCKFRCGTSARHAQSYPSVSIVYSCKCTCSLSDKQTL